MKSRTSGRLKPFRNTYISFLFSKNVVNVPLVNGDYLKNHSHAQTEFSAQLFSVSMALGDR